MEAFSAYGLAMISIAGCALIGLVLGPVSAARNGARGVVSGSLPQPDYADPAYRWSRAHLNLTEMMGLFAAAAMAAILAGANPFWVNLLACVFFLGRIAVAIVHISGVGKPDAGPRTMVFTIGWLASIALAILAIFAAL